MMPAVAPATAWLGAGDAMAGIERFEETAREVLAGGQDCGAGPHLRIAAPRGTCTGWSLHAAAGLRGERCDRAGSYLEFAPDAATRAASGDPRPSPAERWPMPERQPQAVAAAALAADRLALPEDAAWFAAGAAP